MPWGVYVSEAYMQKWAQPIAQAMERPVEELFEVLPQSHRLHAILKKQSNSHRCMMLDDDKRCRIHKHLGEAAKPKICREYPRMTLHTPQRHYTNTYLLHSCFSVARQEPQPWKIEYGFQPLQAPTPEPVFSLIQGKSMTRASFHLWIATCLDTLLTSEHVWQSFWRLLRYLQELSSIRQPVLTVEHLPEEVPAFEASQLNPLNATEQKQLLQEIYEQLEPQAEFQNFREWLLHQPLYAIRETAEDARWEAYQNQYFQRAMLSQSYVVYGYANALQQLYLWSHFGLIQALLTRYHQAQTEDATLTQEHLGRATNLLHALLVQSPDNAEKWGIKRWPDTLCYLKIFQSLRARCSL